MKISAMIRMAAGEIGPYLKISGRLYKIDMGKGHPGRTFRAAPVMSGGQLGKEKDFKLSEDGKTLSYYKNHRERYVPVPFEDVGEKPQAKKPSPTAFKKIIEEPEVKRAISMGLHAVQKDKEKAKWLAVAVLEDVNAHKGAEMVEHAIGKGTRFEISLSQISQVLDWGTTDAAAFGAGLLQGVGDSASATKLLKTYIDTYPDEWEYLQ